jgi:hypothetical protein
MDKKVENYASMIGMAVESLIKASHSEIGVFIPQMKNGAMGLFMGGRKGTLDDKIVPFLKECIIRMQEVIDAHEKGGLPLSEVNDGRYVYDKESGSFKTFDEHEQEGGFSA